MCVYGWKERGGGKWTLAHYSCLVFLAFSSMKWWQDHNAKKVGRRHQLCARLGLTGLYLGGEFIRGVANFHGPSHYIHHHCCPPAVISSVWFLLVTVVGERRGGDGRGGTPHLCLFVGGNWVRMLNAEIKKQEMAELNSMRLHTRSLCVCLWSRWSFWDPGFNSD